MYVDGREDGARKDEERRKNITEACGEERKNREWGSEGGGRMASSSLVGG